MNAQPLVDVGAGVVVRDEDLTADVVAQLVGDLVVDAARLADDERGGRVPGCP